MYEFSRPYPHINPLVAEDVITDLNDPDFDPAALNAAQNPEVLVVRSRLEVADEVLIAETVFTVNGKTMEHETQNEIEYLTRLEDFGGTGDYDESDLFDYPQSQALVAKFGTLKKLLAVIKKKGFATL